MYINLLKFGTKLILNFLPPQVLIHKFFPNREYDNSRIVTLPSNFKVAKFEDDKSNKFLIN